MDIRGFFRSSRRPTSLLTRVLSSVLLLIASTGLLVGYTGVRIIENFTRERFEARMQFLARHLALNSELGLLIDERNMLERLTDNALTEKGVVRVSIENSNGIVVAESMRESHSVLNQVSHIVASPGMDEENVIFGVGSPLDALLDEKIIGKVTIFYTDEDLKALVTSLNAQFTLIAVGVCLLGAFLMLLIARSILAPLRNLVIATQRVANGELNLAVEGGHLKETVHLSQSFNSMVNSIRESRTALRETYEELAKQKNMAEVGKFSMVLTHEFKNPLSIIKGSLDILKKPGIPAETSALMMRYVEEEVQRINRLIEEFLLFSKPKKPDLKLRSGHAVMERVAEKFRVGVADTGPRITCTVSDAPSTVLLDETLFTRALENILKNAVEVSENDSVVSLSSYSKDAYWIIEIADEGPGILPQVEGLIFEPFYTTKATGTGLGLAIAAHAIAAQGGKIEVAKEPKEGTTFIISLPLAPQPTENGGPSGSDSSG